MDLLFPDVGLLNQLSRILTPGVNYHLFTNNVVPDLNITLSGLIEAAWSGYAPIAQSWSNFTITGVAGHNGFALAAPASWTNASGGSVSVYGYYVTDTTNSVLLAVARFDGAPIVIPNGGSYNVTPSWGDFSGLSS